MSNNIYAVRKKVRIAIYVLVLLIFSLGLLLIYSVFPKKYKDNGNKDEVKEASNKLSSLTIDNINLDFNKDVNDYKLTVSNDIVTININTKLVDENAKVIITGNQNMLDIGSNVIFITVIPSSGEKNIYKLEIIREGKLLVGKYVSTADNMEYIQILDDNKFKAVFNYCEGYLTYQGDYSINGYKATFNYTDPEMGTDDYFLMNIVNTKTMSIDTNISCTTYENDTFNYQS
jgi:hypothetical protein